MEERRRCTTVRQLEVMLEFLEGHRDLALGRVRSMEARAVAQRLWRECAELLNGLGPARTAKEWSRAWNDQKTRVRAKLVKINASQRATGGGPSNAPTLTLLEDKVANIIGRDVGPLPNVAQDHFAMNEGDTLNESQDIVQINVDGENIEEMLVEGGNISPLVLNMEAAEHENEVEVPLLQEVIEPLQSQLEPQATPAADRVRRTRERRRTVRASRAPTAQPSLSHQIPPAPQVQSRSALDESRQMVIKIEELKAQTALENAQAANRNAQAAQETAVAINTMAQSFKLIAESIDRMSRQYCASQQIQLQPE